MLKHQIMCVRTQMCYGNNNGAIYTRREVRKKKELTALNCILRNVTAAAALHANRAIERARFHGCNFNNRSNLISAHLSHPAGGGGVRSFVLLDSGVYGTNKNVYN